MASLIDQTLAILQPQDVVDWYVLDLRNGNAAATDNAFRKLRRVVSWALGDGLIKEDITLQMAHNQRRISVPSRNTRLEINKGEPGQFAIALANYGGIQAKHTEETIKHILLLSLLTGRRAKELKQMQWDWVDFERGLITIPGEVIAEDDLSTFEGTKNRQDFILPMARIVRTMLHEREAGKETILKKALAEQNDDVIKAASRYVFLGRDRKKPISNFRKTLERILKSADLDPKTPHDLRRTFSDIVHLNAKDFYTTQMAMGHTVNKITAEYLGDMSISEKAKLFQAVSNSISQSMPLKGLVINGSEFSFSGQEILDEDNITEIDDRGFNEDALEYLLFPKRIWRKGWISHRGFEDAVYIAELAEAKNNHV